MAKQLPQTTTTKKVKYKGVAPFIDANTGELREFHVTDIEDRDFNFSKVWMKNFISSLELIGNKKLSLCFWLIDHLNKENQIALNYRQISDATNVSYQTVAFTMRILQDADFLRKVGTTYMVNPDIIFKGSKGARMALLQEYHALPHEELTDEEKIANLKNSIMGMQRKLDQLEKKQNIVDAEIDPQLSFNEQGEIVERAK